MSQKASQHTSSLDRTYVESVFDSYSVKREGNDEQALITKANAILALEEIFKMWKIDLSVSQQEQLKSKYF
jgi:hypothetical protein